MTRELENLIYEERLNELYLFFLGKTRLSGISSHIYRVPKTQVQRRRKQSFHKDAVTQESGGKKKKRHPVID